MKTEWCHWQKCFINTPLGLATSFHNFVRISNSRELHYQIHITLSGSSKNKIPHYIFPTQIKNPWQFLHHTWKHLNRGTWLEMGVKDCKELHAFLEPFIKQLIFSWCLLLSLFVYSPHQGWTKRMVRFFGKILWNKNLNWT